MRVLPITFFLAAITLGALQNVSCQQPATRPPDASRSSGPATATTAASVAPSAAPSGVLPAVSDILVNEPTRRVVRLDNGLTVILQQNKTAPVVAARIYIRAGSITEGKWMGTGLSHVLEHLVAGATSARRKEAESAELLRTIGNDSNAFTTWDHTCYFITTTAAKWPTAIDLLADWVTNTSFTDDEFAREYKVVQREIEMGEAEADRTYFSKVFANRYLSHPARHPIIGYKNAFQKLTAADAREYFASLYVPDNMVVSIAGDIDLPAAETLVREKFSHVQRKKVPDITMSPEIPVSAPRTLVARADVRQARLQIAFATVNLYSDEMYPLDVLAGTLAGGESAILVRDLRDQRGLVSSVDAYNYTPSWGDGTFTISMQLAPEKIPEARNAVMTALARVGQRPLDRSELQKVQARVAAELIYNNQTAEQQASRAAEDFLTTGSIDFSRLYAQRIRSVSPEQVQAAARKYLRPEAMLVTALLPLNAPDTVSPGAATSAARVARQPVEKTTLPNGLTVLKCRNPAAPIVAMQLYVTGGLLAEGPDSNGLGNAMAELMTRGAGGRSANDISDFLDATAGSLNATSGNNTFSLAAVCLKEHFPKYFELFRDVATAPAFAPDELEKVRPLLLAAIERQTEDWSDEGLKFIREQYYETSPYRRLASGDAAVVAKITPEQVRRHYEQYFRNPRQMVLAVYGDFDETKLDAAALAAFAQIKPVDVKLNFDTTLAKPHRATQPTEKGSSTVMLAYGPGMVADSDDRHAMLVLSTMLGGYNSPGGSILFDTLRGKGLVYTVQASTIPGVRRAGGEAPGMFLVSALGEPANADEIVTLIEKTVADFRNGRVPDGKGGSREITDKDVASARDQAITGQQLQNQTIQSQAADQALDELIGLGYNDNDKFAARVGAVTRADVLRAARKYLGDPVIAVTKPKK